MSGNPSSTSTSVPETSTTSTTALPDTTTATTIASPVSPLAANDEVTTSEDQPVAIAVLDNDTDPNGESLTVAAFDEVSAVGGTVVCDDTTCTYTPPPEYSGSDSFTYTVTDGTDRTATAVVSISVSPVNDAPVAVADNESTAIGTSVIVYILANDTDAEGESRNLVSFDTTSEHGGAISCGTFCVFVPADGFVGQDTFTYVIEDDAGNQATGVVTIDVG